jgi:hypothetical protein
MVMMSSSSARLQWHQDINATAVLMKLSLASNQIQLTSCRRERGESEETRSWKTGLEVVNKHLER